MIPAFLLSRPAVILFLSRGTIPIITYRYKKNPSRRGESNQPETERMYRYVLICGMVSAVALTTTGMLGCGSHEPVYTGKEYPPTEKVETVFQESRIPESCRVFAHLFATMPAGYTGRDFVAVLSGEARSRGADMMLVGQSRQCTTKTELAFDYYGPDREYRIAEWPGWSFGFDEWGKQGAWAGIGYDEWGNGEVYYDYPIILQAVFLRCQRPE